MVQLEQIGQARALVGGQKCSSMIQVMLVHHEILNLLPHKLRMAPYQY